MSAVSDVANLNKNVFKNKVTGSRIVKIVLAHYFREKCIDSCKTKRKMTLIPCCTFRQIGLQCDSENAYFSV